MSLIPSIIKLWMASRLRRWDRTVAGFRGFRFSGRGFWRWLGISVVAILAAAIIALYFLDWNQLRGPIGRWLSHHYGREVRIDGNLQVKLFTWQPKIDVGGLYIGNPGWVTAKQGADLSHAHVELRLLPLFRGQLILPVVDIEQPDILVVRDANGRTNWDSGSSGKTGWNLPPIRRFLVRDGHVVIDDDLRKLHFTGAINSSEDSGERGAAFTMNGDGTLNGNKFTADVHGGPLLNVDESKPYAFTADIHAGDTHVTADGSVTHPFHLDRYAAAVTISGPDLSELYYLTGLALPGTPPYHLQGQSAARRRGIPFHRHQRHGGILRHQWRPGGGRLRRDSGTERAAGFAPIGVRRSGLAVWRRQERPGDCLAISAA